MRVRSSGRPTGTRGRYRPVTMRPEHDIGDQVKAIEQFLLEAERFGVRGLKNGDAAVTGERGTHQRVVLFFSHADFPGVRFGYRCKPPNEDRYEEVWLGEELATGALHRTMRYDAPAPDETGIIWLRLHGQLLGLDDENVLPRLVLRSIPRLEATEAGTACGIFVPGQDRPQACRGVAVVRSAGTAFTGLVDAYGRWLQRWAHLYVGACADHVEELQRRCAIRGGRVEPLG